jgi:NAD(P)-dependent dehydrogenase (short-subunit alcohol dehydrogenase family)
MNIVITGANRGIGLELARQYLLRGDSIYAAVRAPLAVGELASLAVSSGGRLHVVACDVAVHSSVLAFAAEIKEPVDVLINNAGVKSYRDELADLDLEDAARIFQVNALGLLRVSIALLPMLRRASQPRIVNISSGLGSIDGNDSGGRYGYRMSKAALNMASRSMAHDLYDEGIVVAVLSPGWVQTDMGGPDAPTLVTDSAAGLISVIGGLTRKDTGMFFGFRGERIPW